MNKKILKLAELPVNCYPDYAYPLSVILNEDKSLDWFYSNFIQIYHTKDMKTSPVNFYYSDLNNRLWDTRFPLLDYQTIHKDTIDKLGIDIIDFIKTIIDTENYCYLYLDEYYLPTSAAYGKVHFAHVQFVYGYDADKSVLFMAGYDKSRHYNYYTNKFEHIRNAYLLCERDFYNDKNNIYIFKYNYQGSPYHFDMKAVYTQTIEYLESKDSSVKYNNCFNSRTGMTFGIHVISRIKDDMDKYKENVIGMEYIDERPFCIMREQKTLMVLRLQYMMDKRYILKDSGCTALFQKLEKEYNILLSLCLKLEIKRDMKVLEKVKVKLEQNYQLEKIAFGKFVTLIEEYL